MKSMKEEIEAIDRKVLSYCEKIETAMGPVLKIKEWDDGPLSGFIRPMDSLELPRAVHRMLGRASNLAWAVQRLPQIDLSFMQHVKETEVEASPRQLDGPRKIRLLLPTWAWVPYPGHAGARVWFSATSEKGQMGPVVNFTFSGDALERNKRVMGDAFTNPIAAIPEVPTALRRKIDPFVGRFDTVLIVGEAIWTATPGDPLVIGVITDGDVRHGFLLGEYDPTKMEKYVIAELAVKPREA